MESKKCRVDALAAGPLAGEAAEDFGSGATSAAIP
jgi:hypothetical protein